MNFYNVLLPPLIYKDVKEPFWGRRGAFLLRSKVISMGPTDWWKPRWQGKQREGGISARSMEGTQGRLDATCAYSLDCGLMLGKAVGECTLRLLW